MSKVKPCPEGMRWISSHLTVKDVAAAIEFYEKAFGFKTRSLMRTPDGMAVHAELAYQDSLIMLGPECPENNSRSPVTLGGTGVTLYTYVEDVDALCERANQAGAKVTRPPQDEFWGDRCCVLTDPDGHSWMFATHVRDVSPEEMQAGCGAAAK